MADLPPTEPRRMVLLSIDERDITQIILQWQQSEMIALPIFPQVPHDAVVRSVNYDPSRRAFMVALEHESFEPAVPGEYLPVVSAEKILMVHTDPANFDEPSYTA